MFKGFFVIAALVLLFAESTASGQGASVSSKLVTPFIGTWAFTMTEPAAFKGTAQTVRIWDENGRIAASFQVGTFPAINVTGVHMDGNMLVLTLGHHAEPPLMENGAPLMAVILLTLDGDQMHMAQMLERSQTIKRGVGKKQ